MPEAVQQKMETAFNSDFSDVRIHEGAAAEAIGAIAYTQGSHIHFAPGEYRPTQPNGCQLLGHELAHVVQQRAGRVPLPATLINTDFHLEAEADAMGAKAAGGEPLSMSADSPSTPSASPRNASIQLKKKFKDQDRDLTGANQDKVAGGAINSVDLITYKQPIGKTMRTGFFKADKKSATYDPVNEQYLDKEGIAIDAGEAAADTGISREDSRLANRAVVTSRYADLLKDRSGRGTGIGLTH